MAKVGEIARCPYCRTPGCRVVLAAGAYPGWKAGRPVIDHLDWQDFLGGQRVFRFGEGEAGSRPCPHLLIFTGRVLARPGVGCAGGPRSSPTWRLEYAWFAPTVADGEVTPAGYWLATLADARDHVAGLMPAEDYSWESVRRAWVAAGTDGTPVRFEATSTVLAARRPDQFLKRLDRAAHAHCMTNARPANTGRTE